MKYRRVTSLGTLDVSFEGFGGVTINGVFIPSARLSSRNIYPEVEPEYDPDKSIVSEMYFDSIKGLVTRKVYDFEVGISHNWKAQTFKNDILHRQIRARVLRNDTFIGGVLYDLADKMLKSDAPKWQADENGNIDEDGLYIEVYLIEVAESDLAGLQAYCDAKDGCELENYNNLT